tara:strand:- start:10349 stop:11230 length:882 start_codon:yes stop_codon:yes gene_type:complete
LNKNKSLSISGVTKKYSHVKALDNISFEIPDKSIFALLGPNGSGKSTLIKILAKLTSDWFGDIICNGHSIRRGNNYLKDFGFIIEDPCFYDYLSAKDNLKIFSRLTNTNFDRIKVVLELVGLTHRGDDKVGKYSYGMKQRLGIAQALLHDPKFLVLDEPNNGLDPIGINQMADLIFRLNNNGKTILLSTHSLVEVDRLCSHVVILKNGNLLIEKEMKSNQEYKFFRVEVYDRRGAVLLFNGLEEVKILAKENNILVISQDMTKSSIDLKKQIEDNQNIKSIHRESDLIKYFYD